MRAWEILDSLASHHRQANTEMPMAVISQTTVFPGPTESDGRADQMISFPKPPHSWFPRVQLLHG